MNLKSFDINKLIKINPFNNSEHDQKKFLFNEIKSLTKFHYNNCLEYRQILDFYKIDINEISELKEVPYLPVNLFKYYNLISSNKAKELKTITSSGTSKNIKSKVFIDKETSILQSRVLNKILVSYLGLKKMPMIVIDKSDIISDNSQYSARAAATLGFKFFSNTIFYALDHDGNLKIDDLKKFINKYKKVKILIFGFTFKIWKDFLFVIKKNKIKFNLYNSILFHGGGWKKLDDLNISNKSFKSSVKNLLNISKVYNYYGMAEQTGSIFTECERGFLHTSNFNEILIRDYNNLEICRNKKKGIVQVFSFLTKSYPGHSLLTEDEGIIYGNNDCKCGRSGKYFQILGRIKAAELKGCSNV